MKKSYIAPAQTVINFNAEQAILQGSVGVDNTKTLDAGSSYSDKKDFSSQIWGEEERNPASEHSMQVPMARSPIPPGPSTFPTCGE